MAGRIRRAWDVLTGKASEPARVPVRRSRTRIRSMGRAFAAAGNGYAIGWNPGGLDANAEIAAGLVRVRERSRDAYRNTAWGRRIIDAYTNAIVSTGIRPTIDVGDRMVRHPTTGAMVRLDDLMYELWEKWGRNPVPGSRMTIYGLQQLACRTWLNDGEALNRIRLRRVEDMPGLPPIQFQPLEADHLPVDKTEQVGNSLNRIYSGIEFDAIGNVAAYHLYREHPGSVATWTHAYETTRIPAESIIHLFRQERPAQVRGVPILSPVLMSLWNLDGFQEATQVGARLANDIAITINRREMAEDFTPDGVATPFPKTDDQGAQETDESGAPLHEVGPGLVYQGNDGEEMTVQRPQAPSNVSDYIRPCLHEIAAGVSMSYNVLAMDMSDSSFAQAKLGLIEQARNVSVLRESVFIPAFLNPLWSAWINAGVMAGLIPDDPRLYSPQWSNPKQQSADELQDAKAAQLRMQMMVASLTETIESEGRDPDLVLKQCAKDRDLCAQYGLVPLWDLSKVSPAGVPQPDPAPEQTTPKTP